MEKQTSIVDLICGMDIPSAPTAEVKIKRLSELAGQDIRFTVKAISYNKLNEINRFDDEYDVNTVRLGVIEPNLTDQKLLDKFDAVTPNDLIKKMLLPGEIVAIARKVEKISGFEKFSVEEIKKK